MSTTFETRRTTICECGQPLSLCDDVAEHGCAPEPGDFTICVYCGLVFEFDSNRIARSATQAAIAEFRALKEYPELSRAVLAYRVRHGVTTALRYSL